MTPTPTQVEARDRREKFQQSIDQRAAALNPAAPVVEATPAPRTPLVPKLPSHPLIDEVMKAVCEYFDVSLMHLCSQRRSIPIVAARHMGMYLCCELTPHSFAKIGQRFGGFDHSTVVHAHNKIKALIVRRDGDGEARAFDVAKLTERLRVRK